MKTVVSGSLTDRFRTASAPLPEQKKKHPEQFPELRTLM
jgi:hypothetical protein